MPSWISALGIGCIGTVCGYILFYSLKRHYPPSAPQPLPIGELIALLAATGAGGAIGGAFIALEGINYIGPYGLGLLAGVGINITLTIWYERHSKAAE